MPYKKGNKWLKTSAQLVEIQTRSLRTGRLQSYKSAKMERIGTVLKFHKVTEVITKPLVSLFRCNVSAFGENITIINRAEYLLRLRQLHSISIHSKPGVLIISNKYTLHFAHGKVYSVLTFSLCNSTHQSYRRAPNWMTACHVESLVLNRHQLSGYHCFNFPST